MDFYVIDNIENYNKRFPFTGNDKSRVMVDQIYLPESGAFWFRSNYSQIERNVNLNSKYLHLHAGLTQFDRMQFDKEPHVVKRTEMFYNPKTKCVEIKIPKFMFKKKILFKKQCVYIGTKLPNRELTITGDIIYDMTNPASLRLYFILNYFGNNSGIKFRYEDEEELPTMEQKMRVEELNAKIAKFEENLKNKDLLSRINLSQ